MSLRIAVFTKNRTNPAYQAARIGADRVASRFGAATIHYVPDEPDSVAEQIALIACAIAEKPDAAVFVPVHETAVNDAILKFDAAGIPLFNIITPTTAGRRICFVGSDDCTLAFAIARYLFARLAGCGEIVIAEGTPASATSRARFEGFAYQRDVARREFSRLASHVRGIDAVLCANDTMALGVLDALDIDTAGRHRPLLVGVNALPEAVAAIAAGRMLATADFDAMKMSCIATAAAIRYLRGEQVPDKIVLPVQIVDASNCSAWNVPFEARSIPDWNDVVPSGA